MYNSIRHEQIQRLNMLIWKFSSFVSTSIYIFIVFQVHWMWNHLTALLASCCLFGWHSSNENDGEFLVFNKYRELHPQPSATLLYMCCSQSQLFLLDDIKLNQFTVQSFQTSRTFICSNIRPDSPSVKDIDCVGNFISHFRWLLYIFVTAIGICLLHISHLMNIPPANRLVFESLARTSTGHN